MNLRYRKNTIQRVLGSHFAPGSSYLVTAYEPGAVASANSSGSTITVYEGHRVAAGDLLLIDPAGANTFTAAVESVTTTTIVFSPETYSVSAGMKIANLGTDTGISAPNYDGSPLTIYSGPDDAAAAIANEIVTANSTGEYEYWHDGGNEIWEIVRNSAGVVVELAVVQDMLVVQELSVASAPTADNVGQLRRSTDGFPYVAVKRFDNTYAWAPWPVRSKNVFTVSKYGPANYRTVQAAVDAVEAAGDFALDNPYLILVDRDEWTGADAIVSLDANGALSDVAIIGSGPGTILRKTVTPGGGTFRINSGSDVLVQRIYIANMRLVNQLTGATGSGGGPPEGTLYVGEEATHPVATYWDDIVVGEMWHDGSHDCIQVFGVDATHTYSPIVRFVGTQHMRCAHDAFTIKGSSRILASCFMIECNDAGINPFITSANAWKTTGVHLNMETGGGYRADALFQIGNLIVNGTAGTNVGTGSAQQQFAAFLMYNSANATLVTYNTPIIEVTNLNADLTFSANSAIKCHVISVDNSQDLTDPVVIPDKRVTFCNVFGKLYQTNAGASAPTPISGVSVNAGTHASSSATVRVLNSYFEIRNDGNGGAGVENSLRTVNAADIIKFKNVVSEQDAAAGSGSITALTLGAGL